MSPSILSTGPDYGLHINTHNDPVIVTTLCTGILVLLLGVVAYIVAYKRSSYSFETLSAYECGFEPIRSPLTVANNMYFLHLCFAFMLFDLEILYLVPGLATIEGSAYMPILGQFVSGVGSIMTLTVGIVTLLLLIIGLVYEYRSGSLRGVRRMERFNEQSIPANGARSIIALYMSSNNIDQSTYDTAGDLDAILADYVERAAESADVDLISGLLGGKAIPLNSVDDGLLATVNVFTTTDSIFSGYFQASDIVMIEPVSLLFVGLRAFYNAFLIIGLSPGAGSILDPVAIFFMGYSTCLVYLLTSISDLITFIFSRPWYELFIAALGPVLQLHIGGRRNLGARLLYVWVCKCLKTLWKYFCTGMPGLELLEYLLMRLCIKGEAHGPSMGRFHCVLTRISCWFYCYVRYIEPKGNRTVDFIHRKWGTPLKEKGQIVHEYVVDELSDIIYRTICLLQRLHVSVAIVMVHYAWCKLKGLARLLTNVAGRVYQILGPGLWNCVMQFVLPAGVLIGHAFIFVGHAIYKAYKFGQHCYCMCREFVHIGQQRVRHILTSVVLRLEHFCRMAYKNWWQPKSAVSKRAAATDTVCTVLVRMIYVEMTYIIIRFLFGQPGIEPGYKMRYGPADAYESLLDELESYEYEQPLARKVHYNTPAPKGLTDEQGKEILDTFYYYHDNSNSIEVLAHFIAAGAGTIIMMLFVLLYVSIKQIGIGTIVLDFVALLSRYRVGSALAGVWKLTFSDYPYFRIPRHGFPHVYFNIFIPDYHQHVGQYIAEDLLGHITPQSEECLWKGKLQPHQYVLSRVTAKNGLEIVLLMDAMVHVAAWHTHIRRVRRAIRAIPNAIENAYYNPKMPRYRRFGAGIAIPCKFISITFRFLRSSSRYTWFVRPRLEFEMADYRRESKAKNQSQKTKPPIDMLGLMLPGQSMAFLNYSEQALYKEVKQLGLQYAPGVPIPNPQEREILGPRPRIFRYYIERLGFQGSSGKRIIAQGKASGRFGVGYAFPFGNRKAGGVWGEVTRVFNRYFPITTTGLPIPPNIGAQLGDFYVGKKMNTDERPTITKAETIVGLYEMYNDGVKGDNERGEIVGIPGQKEWHISHDSDSPFLCAYRELRELGEEEEAERAEIRTTVDAGGQVLGVAHLYPFKFQIGDLGRLSAYHHDVGGEGYYQRYVDVHLGVTTVYFLALFYYTEDLYGIMWQFIRLPLHLFIPEEQICQLEKGGDPIGLRIKQRYFVYLRYEDLTEEEKHPPSPGYSNWQMYLKNLCETIERKREVWFENMILNTYKKDPRLFFQYQRHDYRYSRERPGRIGNYGRLTYRSIVTYMDKYELIPVRFLQRQRRRRSNIKFVLENRIAFEHDYNMDIDYFRGASLHPKSYGYYDGGGKSTSRLYDSYAGQFAFQPAIEAEAPNRAFADRFANRAPRYTYYMFNHDFGHFWHNLVIGYLSKRYPSLEKWKNEDEPFYPKFIAKGKRYNERLKQSKDERHRWRTLRRRTGAYIKRQLGKGGKAFLKQHINTESTGDEKPD